MKKRKILIIVSIIMGVFICAGLGIYIWYINSPFVTVKKLMTSVKEKDIDSFIECIEPETAQKIQWPMDFTGITSDDLIDIVSDKSDEDTDNNKKDENTSIKISDYSRDGDKASIMLTITDENGTIETKEINFVCISDSWYLTINLTNILL
mgnify:FL=1|jgi:hypothetical protein